MLPSSVDHFVNKTISHGLLLCAHYAMTGLVLHCRRCFLIRATWTSKFCAEAMHRTPVSTVSKDEHHFGRDFDPVLYIVNPKGRLHSMKHLLLNGLFDPEHLFVIAPSCQHNLATTFNLITWAKTLPPQWRWTNYLTWFKMIMWLCQPEFHLNST